MSVKFFRITASVMDFLFHGSLIHKIEKNDTKRIQKVRKKFQQSSKKILKQFGVEVTIRGRKDLLHSDSAFLVLGNHSSYLDMMILGANYPCLFVSSVEQRDNGILGMIAKAAGTIFVDRVRKSKLPSDVQQVSECLKKNIPLCLFLEGTTNNGRQLLRFKSSLLKAIEGKPTQILPICIRYTKLNGVLVEGDNFDTICWYGDMTFFPHFYKLSAQKSIEAELIILDPFTSKADLSRKEIADIVFQQISEVFYSKNQPLLETPRKA